MTIWSHLGNSFSSTLLHFLGMCTFIEISKFAESSELCNIWYEIITFVKYDRHPYSFCCCSLVCWISSDEIYRSFALTLMMQNFEQRGYIFTFSIICHQWDGAACWNLYSCKDNEFVSYSLIHCYQCLITQWRQWRHLQQWYWPNSSQKCYCQHQMH